MAKERVKHCLGVKGRLFYVIGPSGVGKDTLLNYVRPRLSHAPVLFAHRYITRPVELTGENHVSLSMDEFENRMQLGCFLFAWQSHELCYGIGQEVADWLEMGINVVINGSRGYLKQAAKIMPDLVPVLIRADQRVLRHRLEGRGRETEEQIVERLERALAFEKIFHKNMHVIDNNGEISVAGQELLTLFLTPSD